MSVLSGKRMRDMFWDLGLSPQLWLINLNQKWNSINNRVIVRIFVRAIDYEWCARKQACVWMEHEGHINAIRRRAPCRLWNSLMSQCHVHSHLNLMSALLRQQVGLSAGRSSSIHPSCLPAMPVKPPHSIPSTNHRMQWHVGRPCGFDICDPKSLITLHLKTY